MYFKSNHKLLKIIILVSFIIPVYSGCILKNSSVKKSAKQRYLVNEPNQKFNLKINGYYYVIPNNITSTFITRFFFYANGKMLTGYDCTNYSDMISSEKDIVSLKNRMGLVDTNSIFWTNFVIHEDSITFERIYMEGLYPHYLFSGHIFNDSTFLISKRKSIHILDLLEHKTIILNDTFHFRKFSPKPGQGNVPNG